MIPLPFPAPYPGDVSVTVLDQLWAHASHPHLADRMTAGGKWSTLVLWQMTALP